MHLYSMLSISLHADNKAIASNNPKQQRELSASPYSVVKDPALNVD